MEKLKLSKYDRDTLIGIFDPIASKYFKDLTSFIKVTFEASLFNDWDDKRYEPVIREYVLEQSVSDEKSIAKDIEKIKQLISCFYTKARIVDFNKIGITFTCETKEGTTYSSYGHLDVSPIV